MTAHLEMCGDAGAALHQRLVSAPCNRLSVEMAVALKARHALARLTEVERRRKPVRLPGERTR